MSKLQAIVNDRNQYAFSCVAVRNRSSDPQVFTRRSRVVRKVILSGILKMPLVLIERISVKGHIDICLQNLALILHHDGELILMRRVIGPIVGELACVTRNRQAFSTTGWLPQIKLNTVAGCS